MDMDSIITDDLLFDFFAGRVTVLQREQIVQWSHDPANEERFYFCLDTWERSKPQYLSDLDEGMKKFQDFLDDKPSEVVVLEKSTPSYPVTKAFWLSAASVLLFLALGTWLLRDKLLMKTIVTPYGQTQTVLLPDGSQVVLNANSTLIWPRFGFGSQNRHVTLEGEAMFRVTHLPNRQKFIVRTAKGIDVVVHGTEFSVFARPRATKVVLTKGKVEVQYPEGENKIGKVMLRPGELVNIDRAGKLHKGIAEHPLDATNWQHHQFVFDMTPLFEIGQLILEMYGTEVIISDTALSRQTLSGSFQAETPEELLMAISTIMNVSVAHHQGKLVVTSIYP